MKQQFAVLGNPGHQRVRMFARAVLDLGHPHPIVLSWLDLLAGRLDLAASLPPGTWLRLDAPEGHPMVNLLLLERGGRHLRRDDLEWGELAYSRTWFSGWKDLLRELGERLAELDLAGTSHTPAGLIDWDDRALRQRQLASASIPQMEWWGPVLDGEHLLQRWTNVPEGELVLRPGARTSAAASLVLARDAEGLGATTTLELRGTEEVPRLIGMDRVRTYRDRAEIARLVDRMAVEGAVAEIAPPKLTFQGHAVDVWVVVVRGQAQQVVLRRDKLPGQPFRLGESRADLAAFRRWVGQEQWTRYIKVAESVVAALPGIHGAGVGLGIQADNRQPWVMEVDAFGDYLPGVTLAGANTYHSFVTAYTAT
ncbi:MAG: STM4014 family protein [Bacteroidota bacterium]